MEKQQTIEQEESTSSSSPILPEIRLEDRIAIFGGTGSGKSILAQVLFRSLPLKWHKVIVDITDSIIEPSALTFYDPENIPWDKAWNLRFVPDIDVDLEEQINALYLSIFWHGACWVWLDEANEITTAHRTAFGLRKVLLQGRKAYVGHASCTPRPADISKSIVTQAQYLISFTLVDFDDRQRVARYIGMTAEELDSYFESLGEYEYLFYDVAFRNLYRVPAIPDDIVSKILNPTKAELEAKIAHPETSLV
jgi:ABC-type bacteriocin/lantibiotic exporters, contain an N-terminal double-glycine peptidase domain